MVEGMRLVGEFDPDRRSTGLSADLLTRFRVVGGNGLWKSMKDYEDAIEEQVPLLPSSKAANKILAALCGIKHKFGAEIANGTIAEFGLDDHGFREFE